MNNSFLPYDLRIGVTGHRTLSNRQAAYESAAKILDHLRAILNDQGRTPLCWTVFSELASGADRIVAEAVLQLPDSRLVAALPFPADEYRRDFTQPADIAEFERFLARASGIVELDVANLDALGHAHETNPSDQKEARNMGYLAAGQFIVDHCEIIIAIWDGMPARGTGGTAQIVQYALDQNKTVFWINVNDPGAAAAKLLEYKPAQTPSCRTASLTDAAETPFPGFTELAKYNRQGDIKTPELISELTREEDMLIHAAQDSGLDAAQIKPALDALLPRYVHADRQAVRYQRRYLFAGRGLFYLSAIAVTLAVIQEVFLHDRPWLSLLEFAAMAAAWLLHITGRRSGCHEKWLQNRYIAERLRTALFTSLAGHSSAPRFSAIQTPLPFYPSPQNWLAASLDMVIAGAQQAIPQEIPFHSLKRFIVRNWIADQRDWHARNARRKSRSAHRMQNTGISLFFLTMLLVILHIFNVGGHESAAPLLSMGKWLVFLVIVLPAWGAVAHAVVTLLEYERIATRSKRMSQALSVIARRAEFAVDLKTFRSAVEEAAEVIGIENHEWWVLLSFRELVLL